MNGFLVLDKPAGLTSHDCVGILRGVTRQRKIGHTGTLDPFATGVLPLALGHATRFIQFLEEGEKEYEATLALGERTSTGDPEGEVVETAPVPELGRVDLSSFLGEQMQEPPAYSAVRVDGKRLYEYARAGVEKRAAPRRIHIHALDVRSTEPFVFHVQCSRGTYVRVLGEDIARGLGTVGHLSQLRRVRSGPFEGGVALDDLAEDLTGQRDWRKAFRGPRDERLPWGDRTPAQERVRARLLPLLSCFGHLPHVDCSDEDARRVRNGRAPSGPEGRFVAVHGGRLLAICETTAGRSRILRGLPTS